MYTNLDQNNEGSFTPAGTGAAGGTNFKPAGLAYQFKDQGIWSGNLRVRRTF
jgi:hypothetical protein